MAFQTNNAGRPKGTKNKIGTKLKGKINKFLLNNFEKMEAEFAKLPPNEQLKMYCRLLEHVVPKVRQSSADEEPPRPSFSLNDEFDPSQLSATELDQLHTLLRKGCLWTVPAN